MLSWVIESWLYACGLLALYAVYKLCIEPLWNPLRRIAGPPVPGWFKNHMYAVLEPAVSSKVHETLVKRYGRTIRIRGLFPLDDRLLTLDPVSVSHILKKSTVYEKPWQSRRLISGLIGTGMLAAEGHVHKRQRRVITPAFSIQNLRELVPVVFCKGTQLKDRWSILMAEGGGAGSSDALRIDICHWISRATFDVIGAAGFDYEFNAIENESNELFCAYKDMFEQAISQGGMLRGVLSVHMPILLKLFPDGTTRLVQRCQNTIHRVAGQLIQERKKRIEEAEKAEKTFGGKDLLSLLMKSNMATDLPPEQRISDEDILNNINTFMFAGSDTSSLTVTWTLLLLAQHPELQTRLRQELLSVSSLTPSEVSRLTDEEVRSLYDEIADLPFLHNVIRESLRLIPAVHSSIRVATEDDEVPTMHPVHRRDGSIDEKRSVTVPKGTFVHVAIEGFSLDKGFWGEDAWEFVPDRWDNLPKAAAELPGLFSNTLSFSAGPRSCIGMRFSLIEIKTFLYLLLTNFAFAPTEDQIIKANVVLTRPFIRGKYREGSQCPIHQWFRKPRMTSLMTGSSGVREGSIFSAIGRGINAVISAIASVIMAIVGAITTVIVTIFNFIGDILCCRCGNRRRAGRARGGTY